MVNKAYDRLDITQNGKVPSSDIKGLYNPTYHPAVLESRKTQDQILQEFLETFQTNHFILKGPEKEFVVTREEFIEYYSNISPSIEDERYFETMITNVWNLAPIPKAEKKKPVPIRTTGKESHDSPLAIKEQLKDVPVAKQDEETKDLKDAGEEDSKSVSAWDTKSAYERHIAQLSGNNVQIVGSQIKHKFGNVVQNKDVPKYQEILLERFRNKLVLRGGKGVIGLERQFKLFDLSGSGFLDSEEFKKAVNDYKLDIDERDLGNIFKVFDKGLEGRVDYEVFLNIVLGIMSEFRLNLVNKAFDQIDEDEDGLITMDQLKKAFYARFHPDIKSGKKSVDEVESDFQKTFEIHHNIFNEKTKDKDMLDLITKDEFITFYNKISAAIESDSYFDAMISGVWRLGLNFNTDKQPYAGVANKVYQVDSKSCWISDHHKTLTTPLSEEEERAKTSTRSGKKGVGMYSPEQAQKKDIPAPKAEIDREIIKIVKDKLIGRGIRGIIGLRRKFAVKLFKLTPLIFIYSL